MEKFYRVSSLQDDNVRSLKIQAEIELSSLRFFTSPRTLLIIRQVVPKPVELSQRIIETTSLLDGSMTNGKTNVLITPRIRKSTTLSWPIVPTSSIISLLSATLCRQSNSPPCLLYDQPTLSFLTTFPESPLTSQVRQLTSPQSQSSLSDEKTSPLNTR